MTEVYNKRSDNSYAVGDVGKEYTSSLWMSGKYDDAVIHEESDYLIIKFKGQNNHQNDKYICRGSYVFMKSKKKYVFKGNVALWTLLEENEVGVANTYKLVVQRYTSKEEEFNKKEEALMHFGLTGGNIMNGIIPHKKV